MTPAVAPIGSHAVKLDVAVLHRVCGAYLELCDRAKGCDCNGAPAATAEQLPWFVDRAEFYPRAAYTAAV